MSDIRKMVGAGCFHVTVETEPDDVGLSDERRKFVVTGYFHGSYELVFVFNEPGAREKALQLALLLESARFHDTSEE